MLKPVKPGSRHVTGRPPKGRFVLVASQYNDGFVNPMLEAAREVLLAAGVERRSILVHRVPGAYEVPLVAAKLASKPGAGKNRISAIICLGVILRGETVHAAHIGEAVSRALMEIQVRHKIPVIHEVLLLENAAQARVRCQGKKHNRGAEAAQTALAMAALMETI
jgi:6,7-dimethyl-8-ribityllumazine synthase